MKLNLVNFHTKQPIPNASVQRPHVFSWKKVTGGAIDIPAVDLDRFACPATKGACFLELQADGFFKGLIEVKEDAPQQTAFMHEITDHLPPWWLYHFSSIAPLEGSRKLTIGVIDSGCGMHPFLKHVRRYCVEMDGETPVCRPEKAVVDQIGHGTHVVGLLAAKDPARKGFSGCLPDANVISVRITDNLLYDDYLSPQKLTAALEFLAEQKVDIINMSFTCSKTPESVRALNDAMSKGILLIAAAGNEGKNEIEYPASHKGVIAISASGHVDHTPIDTISFARDKRRVKRALASRRKHFRWSGSNHGKKSLWCPGVGTFSTWPQATHLDPPHYFDMDGTSMACAIASGTIGRIIQREHAALDTLKGRSRVAKIGQILRLPRIRGMFVVPP